MEAEYIFIAGGIGITPFRSMLSDLIYKKKQMAITLFYIVSKENEVLFQDIIAAAKKEIGLRVVYCVTDNGERFTLDLLQNEVADWKSRMYYISGPQEMVEAIRAELMNTGISEEKIKVDLFTGY